MAIDDVRKDRVDGDSPRRGHPLESRSDRVHGVRKAPGAKPSQADIDAYDPVAAGMRRVIQRAIRENRPDIVARVQQKLDKHGKGMGRKKRG